MFDMVCACNLYGVGYDELLCFRFFCVSCPSIFILCVFDMDGFFSDYLGFLCV